ncbi:GatB/YqeY domain-containing protein [Patescibacteria group bacterium]|nr:GatB/YqeY domain-containing protein [Patescibacteria group bacterium]
MKLHEQLKEDVKIAMKAKDMDTLNVLRGALTSIQNKAIELKKELEDAEIIFVLKSDMKKLQDSLQDFISAARTDLVEKAEKEIAILKKYLPEELSDDAVMEKVKEVLAEQEIDSMEDFGRAMGAAMDKLKDRIDGSRVKKAIEILLKKD